MEDKNYIQNKNKRKNKATNDKIIVNLKYKHVLQKKYKHVFYLSNSPGTPEGHLHNVGLFFGHRGPFVETALKYTYKPHKFCHRIWSIKIISYESALAARIYLFISPRKHLIHREFAHVVTSVIPNQEDRQISMLMKFTKKIFFCSIEILQESFPQYANNESQIVMSFVILHTDMSLKYFNLPIISLENINNE